MNQAEFELQGRTVYKVAQHRYGVSIARYQRFKASMVVTGALKMVYRLPNLVAFAIDLVLAIPRLIV